MTTIQPVPQEGISANGAPPAEVAQPRARARGRLAAIVGKLAFVNLVVLALTALSGPLQARALGPGGRGDLAAIAVPFMFASVVASLGFNEFCMRVAARGRNLGEVIGTLSVLILIPGFIVVAGAIPLAHLLAHGRHTVYMWLAIGLCVVPLTLLGGLVLALAAGLQKWNLWIASRLLSPAAILVGLAVADLAGVLSVGVAAAITLGATLLAFSPLLLMVRQIFPLRFNRSLAREAIPFGIKAWLGNISMTLNLRLDQLLMAGLVSSRSLGFYAVAVTVANLTDSMTAALGGALFPRIAAGDTALTARALRMTLYVTAALGAGMALIAPVVIPLVFGGSFGPSIALVRILVIGALPRAGSVILATAMTSSGRPGIPALGEGSALLVTVVGLLLLLGPLAATGAAIVSIVAYSTNFAILLTRTRKYFGGRWRDYLWLNREDVRWGGQVLRGILNRRAGRAAA